jgi:hypothetical protein
MSRLLSLLSRILCSFIGEAFCKNIDISNAACTSWCPFPRISALPECNTPIYSIHSLIYAPQPNHFTYLTHPRTTPSAPYTFCLYIINSSHKSPGKSNTHGVSLLVQVGCTSGNVVWNNTANQPQLMLACAQPWVRSGIWRVLRVEYFLLFLCSRRGECIHSLPDLRPKWRLSVPHTCSPDFAHHSLA